MEITKSGPFYYLAVAPDVYVERTRISTHLFDCNGDEMFSLPGVHWTDQDMQLILTVANASYSKGVGVGRHLLQREIRTALGIEEQS